MVFAGRLGATAVQVVPSVERSRLKLASSVAVSVHVRSTWLGDTALAANAVGAEGFGAAAADAVPVERRPWVAVDTVTRGIDGVPTIAVGTPGDQVITAVQRNPGSTYLVTAGEDVVGVLHIADLAQLLEPDRKMKT